MSGTEVWVYSVFYESARTERHMPGVRAVGVASVGGAMELECHVIYNDSRRDHVIRKLEYAEDGNKQK